MIPEEITFKWQKALENRKTLGSLRELKTSSSLVDFSSNDYLGLAKNESLIEKIEQEYSTIKFKNKLGSTGSRLISGNNKYFEETEAFLSQLHISESCLLFNTGYMANLALLSTLPQKGDTIVYDELSHASIKDGIRLSLADRYPFFHNDLSNLETKLKKAKGLKYVAVESVYSMDGDFAPLQELATICKKHDALLIVDEAHTSGIFGINGAGYVQQLNLHNVIPIRVHTFGKAIGCHGAAIVGPKVLREYLINFARPFIYTTAFSLHSVLAIKNSYRFLIDHPQLQLDLQKKITLFNHLTNGLTNKIPSQSAIHAFVFEGNENVKSKAKFLQENNFDVRPILSPTVKKGSERLRICLHLYNTEKEIEDLAEMIAT